MHEQLAVRYRAAQKSLVFEVMAALGSDNSTCMHKPSSMSPPQSFSLSDVTELQEAVQEFNDWMEEQDLQVS